MNSLNKNYALLAESMQCWEKMADFRAKRERCKRYCYGDQWGDTIAVDGKKMREEQYIRLQGNEPLKNNLIRRLVKQVLGLYRSERLSTVLQTADKRLIQPVSEMLENEREANYTRELDARALEEFLISGMAVQRKTFGLRDSDHGIRTDNVHLGRFFIDTLSGDCRGWDVELLGEIHDLRMDALLAMFAQSPADIRELSEIYRVGDYQERLFQMLDQWGQPSRVMPDFLRPSTPGLCRVIEVWRKERRQGILHHDRDNGVLHWVDVSCLSCAEMHGSLSVETQWHYYYLTPFGDIITHGVSPYAHGAHPYVVKAYPFIDGEIHSFVDDVIDQQRYTNRLITLYDWVMRSSAKGVLLVPEECIPDGSSIEDIAEEWAHFNGVIPVRTRNTGVLPHQVSANAVNIGINELLQTQLNFMEDISGVTGALQGKMASASVSGKLFEQQTHNATLSQLDLLDTFRHFIHDGMKKELSLLQQFSSDTMLRNYLPDDEISTFRQSVFRLTTSKS